jgi:hypothetical protein
MEKFINLKRIFKFGEFDEFFKEDSRNSKNIYLFIYSFWQNKSNGFSMKTLTRKIKILNFIFSSARIYDFDEMKVYIIAIYFHPHREIFF